MSWSFVYHHQTCYLWILHIALTLMCSVRKFFVLLKTENQYHLSQLDCRRKKLNQILKPLLPAPKRKIPKLLLQHGSGCPRTSQLPFLHPALPPAAGNTSVPILWNEMEQHPHYPIILWSWLPRAETKILTIGKDTWFQAYLSQVWKDWQHF